MGVLLVRSLGRGARRFSVAESDLRTKPICCFVRPLGGGIKIGLFGGWLVAARRRCAPGYASRALRANTGALTGAALPLEPPVARDASQLAYAARFWQIGTRCNQG